jgi:hypothetical protein
MSGYQFACCHVQSPAPATRIELWIEEAETFLVSVRTSHSSYMEEPSAYTHVDSSSVL